MIERRSDRLYLSLKKERRGGDLKIYSRARNRDDHRAFARRLPTTRGGSFLQMCYEKTLGARGGLPTAVPINNNPRFDATERASERASARGGNSASSLAKARQLWLLTLLARTGPALFPFVK